MLKHILIVDDEEQVLLGLQEALDVLGGTYAVSVAGSGVEALQTIQQVPVDLVITDIRMPGMDGVDLTQAIRAQSPTTAVVWMTAYGGTEIRTAARRLGVRYCLEKPLGVGLIRRMVRQLVGDLAEETVYP
jgi:YesN/AraC family two-component response regulator